MGLEPTTSGLTVRLGPLILLDLQTVKSRLTSLRVRWHHAQERSYHAEEWQKMATMVRGEQDVIAFCREKDQAYVQVFFVRSGKLIGRDGFTLQGTRSADDRQIMTSFVKQFYDSAGYIPPLILLQHPVED